MDNNRLYILWTNDNIITSEHMVMMYATNTRRMKLWEGVTVIIWGATSKLVAENSEIQRVVAEAQEAGVVFSACESCANNLGTKEALLGLGIEVKFWGAPLTELIKSKANLLTI